MTVDEAQERVRAFTGSFFDFRRKAIVQPAGPLTLELKIGKGGFFDLDQSEEVVLSWDDATIIERHLDVVEGETVVIPIPEKKGRDLEVWISDDLTVSAEQFALSDADRRVQIAAGAAELEASQKTPFQKAIENGIKIGSLQLSVGIVLVGVLGVGYLVYTSKR